MTKIFQKGKLISFLLVFFLSVLPITWFRGNLIYHGDQGYPINPWSDFQNFSLFFWNHLLATGYSSTGGLAMPFSYIFPLLSSLGIPLWLTQAFQYSFLFLLAGFSVQHLVKSIHKSKSADRVAIFSSLAYLFSFYQLFSFWSAFVNLAYFYATAPLLLALYIRYLKSQKTKHFLAWLAVITFIATPAFANPAYIILTFFLHFFFFIYFWTKKGSSFFFGISCSLKLAFFFLLLNSWWILPNLANISNSLQTSEAVEVSGSEGILDLSSSETSLQNVLRFFGPWTFKSDLAGDQYYPWHSVYDKPLFIFLSYLGPIIVFSTLFFKKTRPKIIFFILLYFAGAFLMKGSHPPLGFINRFLVLKIPYFVVFRNGYEKFGVFALLGYSVCFGFGFNNFAKILRRLNGETISRFVVAITCVLLFGVYMWPYWTGDLIYGGGKLKPSARVLIPDEYKKAQSWLNEQKGDFRLISLPRQVGAAYRWEKGVVGADDPTLRLFGRSIISPFFPSDNLLAPYLTNVFSYFTPEGRDETSSFPLLRFTGSKYALVHEDALMNLNTVADSLTTKEVEDVLKYCGLMPEKKFGNLSFYQFPKDWQYPKFYVAKKKDLIFPVTPRTYNQTASLIDDGQANATFSFSDSLPGLVKNGELKMSFNDKSFGGIPLVIFANSDLVQPDFFSSIGQKTLVSFYNYKYTGNNCYAEKSEGSKQTSFTDLFLCLSEKASAITSRVQQSVYQEDLIKNDLASYQDATLELIKRFEKTSADQKVDYLNILQAITKIHYRQIVASLANNELGNLIDDTFSEIENSLIDITGSVSSSLTYHLPVLKSDVYKLAIVPPPTENMNPKIKLPSGDEISSHCSSEKCVSDELLLNKEGGIISLEDYHKRDDNLIKNNWQRSQNQPHMACETIDTPYEDKTYYLSVTVKLIKRRAGVFMTAKTESAPKENLLFSSVFSRSEQDKNYQWWLNLPSGVDEIKLCFYETVGDTSGVFTFEKVKFYPLKIPNLFAFQKSDHLSIKNQAKISFQRINPTLYFVSVEGVDEEQVLVFNETFDPRWHIYFYEKSANIGNHLVKTYFGDQVNEYEPRMKYFDITVISNLFNHPIPESNHLVANGFANSWVITKETSKNLGKYSLVVEFVPQRWCYLGLLTTVITALSLVFLARKRTNIHP